MQELLQWHNAVILLVSCAAGVLLALLLAGCIPEHPTSWHAWRVCCDDKARAEWTLACTGSANPRSDDEPEDWIDECGEQAEEIFCRDVEGIYDDIRHAFVPYESEPPCAGTLRKDPWK